MIKVLITDPIEKSCVDILTQNNFEVNLKPGLKEDEIINIIKDYEILIVRSGTKVNQNIISKAKILKLIGRTGAGVDNIDVESATRKGIIVMNTPGGNTLSTAEHTMALLLAMCRNISQASAELRSGIWNRKKYMGTELYDKTIGIIGLGKIGKEVAIRCKAFGMKVIGYDPLISTEFANKLGIEIVELNHLLRNSDIITIHIPLSPETKYFFDEEKFALCKKGVKIINAARGGIVSEKALLDALQSEKISAAALDVFEKEPPIFPNELITHPKVTATPHIGASTEEAQEKVAIQIAEQIVEYYKNKKLIGAVNAVALEKEINDEIKPFVSLAEKLGSIQAQLTKSKLKKISITFSGMLLHNFRDTLTAALLKGLLSKLITANVNLINAQLLAEETGIIITEKIETENETFRNLLTVEFQTESDSHSFSGTIFGKSEIRIVKVDDFPVEINPSQYMLIYYNIDQPGMLASVGKILAHENINIAGLSLGRKSKGSEAITIMNIDSYIDKTIHDKISALDGVFDVAFISL